MKNQRTSIAARVNVAAWVVAALIALGAQHANAMTTVLDLRTATSSDPELPGNVYSVTDDGIMFTIRAFAYEGHGSSASAAHLSLWDSGFGITNTVEAGGGTYPAGKGPHSADNLGSRDIFLIEFSEPLILHRALLSAWNPDGSSGPADSDVTYWSGSGMLTTPGDLDTGSLGTGTTNTTDPIDEGNFRGFDLLSPGPVDWLLIGARLSDPQQSNDGFKLTALKYETTAVPLPAAAWAGLSGLGLIGALRRRYTA